MGALFHLQGIGFKNNRITLSHVEDIEGSGKNKFFSYMVNLARGGNI